MKLLFTVVTVLVTWSGVRSAEANEPPADVRALEGKIIAAHLKLISGVLRVDSTFDHGKDRGRVATIWFDFSKMPQLRSDTVWSGGDSRVAYGRQVVCDSQCLTGEPAVFRFNEREPDPSMIPSVTVVNPANMNNPNYRIIDPRAVGLAPVDTMNLVYFKYGDVITADGRGAFTSSDEIFAGQQCHRVSFTERDGGRCTYIASAAAPEQVLHIEFTIANQRDAADFTYTFNAQLGVWLPSTESFTGTLGGKVDTAEHATFAFSDLSGVKSKQFCLAGMDIPPGTPVQNMPAKRWGGRVVWNGETIVNAKALSATSPRAGWSWGQTLVILLNVVVVTILILLIARARRLEKPRRQ